MSNSMWQLYTERTRRVFFYANGEAARLGANRVQPEHLLLGILQDDENFACNVIRSLELDPVALATEVRSLCRAGSAIAINGVGLSRGANAAIKLMHVEAGRLKDGYIGTEHLLLGLIAERHGVPAKLFSRIGVDLEKARQAVVRLQESTRSQPTASVD